MVLFPCSPELFDRRFRVMTAGLQYKHCVMCATRKPAARDTGRRPDHHSRHDHRHRQVYKSLLDPSARKPPRRPPEETAP